MLLFSLKYIVLYCNKNIRKMGGASLGSLSCCLTAWIHHKVNVFYWSIAKILSLLTIYYHAYINWCCKINDCMNLRILRWAYFFHNILPMCNWLYVSCLWYVNPLIFHSIKKVAVIHRLTSVLIPISINFDTIHLYTLWNV